MPDEKQQQRHRRANNYRASRIAPLRCSEQRVGCVMCGATLAGKADRTPPFCWYCEQPYA